MKRHADLNDGGNCGEAFGFYERHLGEWITFRAATGTLPLEKA